MFKRIRCKMSMNLQLFAGEGEGGGTGGTGAQGGQGTQQQSGPEIDYNRIQQMLGGTLKAKENSALNAYFKQQGLSQQEIEQASIMRVFYNKPEIHPHILHEIVQ